MNYQFKKAAAYSVLAYFMIALGTVAWKNVIANYSVSQILALEALACFPLFIGLAKIKGGIQLLKTSYPFLQIFRGLLQALAAYVGLYGLSHLPVSTYTMLGYCTPFIMALSGWMFLKEKYPPIGWLCILAGFIGTALIIQPEYAQNFIATLAVVVSCCFWVANVILMKRMPKDDVISFPFYTTAVTGFISCTIVVASGIIPMSWFDFGLVVLGGIFVFIGAQLLFVTYRLSSLSYLAPLEYIQVVWVVVLSYFLWADMPTLVQVTGVVIVSVAATCPSFLKKEETETLE